MRTYAGIAVIGLVAIGCLYAFAQAGPRGWQGGGEGIFEALVLTSEQRDKMKSMRLEQGKQMAQLRADLQIARLELRGLMHDQDSKRVDVKAKVAAVNAARSKIFETRVDFRFGLRNILTTEQREKLQNMDHGQPGLGRGRRLHRRGRGFRHHDGPGMHRQGFEDSSTPVAHQDQKI